MNNFACCVQVIDVGTQQNKRELVLGWELLLTDRMSTAEPIIVYKSYQLSIATDSDLRKDVEQMLGGNINAESYKRFSPKALLGSYCLLILSYSPTCVEDGSLCVSRAQSLSADLDQTALPRPKTPYGFFMTSEPDMELLSQLPTEIQARIKQSIEFTWTIKNQSEHDHDY